MAMDERKFRILQAIIDDYILTAVPVGSRTISKKYDMGLSSATIRNEMSDLEELGYLDQPHVSAGRIPSAKAYRLYVDQLLKGGVIPGEEAVDRFFASRVHKMEELVDRAAQVLSSLTKYTAVVLPPTGPKMRIRNIQLVSVTPDTALMVIVTDAGVVRDSVVQVSRQLDPDTLYTISRALTDALAGCTMEEACERMPILMARMEENAAVLRQVGNYITETRTRTPLPHVGIGGASNILSWPEYSDVEKAKGFLSLLETRDKLAEIVAGQGNVALTVRIGPETGVPEMSDCSIVTATYATQSGRQGTIGVIGPTRMQYSRVLTLLRAMGQQLTDILGDPPDENRK